MLPSAETLTLTDKLAAFNDEGGVSGKDAIKFVGADVDANDSAWGDLGDEVASRIESLRPVASRELESLASKRKEAVRSKEYLKNKK
jgi:hypothetical protein